MSERGFSYFIVTIIAASVLAQLYSLLIGILVAGVALLFGGPFLSATYIACRSDRKQLETITLRDGIIQVVRRRTNCKVISSAEAPAFGLEMAQATDPDFSVQRIELRHRGKTSDVGSDLSPVERQSFAEVFKRSLSDQDLQALLSEKQHASTSSLVTQN